MLPFSFSILYHFFSIHYASFVSRILLPLVFFLLFFFRILCILLICFRFNCTVSFLHKDTVTILFFACVCILLSRHLKTDIFFTQSCIEPFLPFLFFFFNVYFLTFLLFSLICISLSFFYYVFIIVLSAAFLFIFFLLVSFITLPFPYTRNSDNSSPSIIFHIFPASFFTIYSLLSQFITNKQI